MTVYVMLSFIEAKGTSPKYISEKPNLESVLGVYTSLDLAIQNFPEVLPFRGIPAVGIGKMKIDEVATFDTTPYDMFVYNNGAVYLDGRFSHFLKLEKAPEH